MLIDLSLSALGQKTQDVEVSGVNPYYISLKRSKIGFIESQFRCHPQSFDSVYIWSAKLRIVPPGSLLNIRPGTV